MVSTDPRPVPVTISVAMTTYLGAPYVLEQLQSIVGQTSPPAEIVVCDDCSFDETVDLVRAFAQTSAVPVRLVVNDEQLGWRENSLKAASLCTAEVIAFCDQDDIWDPRKLELLGAAFADPEVLVVFHDATIVDADLAPLGPFLQGEGEPDLARSMERGPWRDVYGFTMAFRRELLELWQYWPTSLDKSVPRRKAAHDQWLLFLGNALGSTRHLPDRLALYRQHDQNAVSAKDQLGLTAASRLLLDDRALINLRLDVLVSRIHILEAIVRDHPRFRDAATSARRRHSAYRRQLAAQAVIHNSNSRTRRLRRFAGLLFRRAYISDRWALGPSALWRDGCVAVLGRTGLARVYRLRLGIAARLQSQSPK